MPSTSRTVLAPALVAALVGGLAFAAPAHAEDATWRHAITPYL